LGFHPENVGRTEHRHNDAFMKVTTSAEAAVAAQEGKGFPRQV
jgi:hypothetical protein